MFEHVSPLKTTTETRGSSGRFGYEWSKYSGLLPIHEEQFRLWTSGIALEDWKDRTFLDVGCGMGRNSYWPMQYGAQSGVAVDLDPRCLQAATRTLCRYPEVKLYLLSAYDLPYDAQFDIVFSIGVLHHLEDPIRALTRMVRAAKPGGRVAIWVYGAENNRWLTTCLTPIRKLVLSRLPIGLLHHLSLYAAAILWVALRLGLQPHEYFRLISRFGFSHLRAIVFDQMLPRISNHWTREFVNRMMEDVGLEELRLDWVNEMSWAAVGTKPYARSS